MADSYRVLGKAQFGYQLGSHHFHHPSLGFRLQRGAAAESCTPAWAAEARTWTTIWIPPWNHRRAQGVAAAPSVVPNHEPLLCIGDPTSSLQGALRGAWRGRTRAPGSGGLEEMSISLSPRRGPCTNASRLLTQRRLTYRPERAPDAGGQAGWREDVSARVCVSACVPVCV